MLKKLSILLMPLLVISGCGAAIDSADLPGTYISSKSDMAEIVVIKGDGTYLHLWNNGEPKQQVGTWVAGPVDEGCLPVTFSKFSSLRRFPGATIVTGTHKTCLERDVFGKLFLVVDRDQGLSLTKK